jgi:hypothetical protein
LQFAYGDGERLYVEPAGGEFALAWTTALPSAALLDLLHTVVALDAGVGIVFNDHGEFREETRSGREAVGLLQERDPAFWRLDLDDRAITWERADQNASVPASGLMGFIGTTSDPSDLTRLVEATATPLVGANAQSLVSDCWPVIDAAIPETRARPREL